MASRKQDIIVEDGAVYVLRAGTRIYVKTADICRMIGKSNQWVGQLVSRGTLNKKTTPHGALFELPESMSDYCDMLEDRNGPEPSEKEQRQEAAQKAAEVTLKVAKATVAKLEADELQGKMHRSEDVAAMTEDLIFSIRGMLVALPGRLAVDVANANTAAEAAEIIRKGVFEVMREIANYRYDPKKYEERVRERRKWETENGHEPHDE